MGKLAEIGRLGGLRGWREGSEEAGRGVSEQEESWLRTFLGQVGGEWKVGLDPNPIPQTAQITSAQLYAFKGRTIGAAAALMK